MERYAVLVAGGSGSRIGADVPKQFLPLADGTPILVKTFQVFAGLGNCALIVVLPESYLEGWRKLASEYKLIHHITVAGGSTRTLSVAAGMAFVPDDALVIIHDGVRPYVSPTLLEACFSAAAHDGAACAAVPSKDSLRRLLPDGSSQAVPREEFYLVQTPQAFQARIWKDAYAKSPVDVAFTDDASLVEAAGYSVAIVKGSYANIKITTPEDMPAGLWP